jgi:putative spermidine/putrescine transport system ATP-binding protein/spermidine/putrescine transport system ATP-binding protein
VRKLDSGRAELDVPGFPAPIEGVAAAGLRLGDPAYALVRPEHVRLDGAFGTGVAGKVEEVVYLGDLVAIRLALSSDRALWCRRFSHEGAPRDEAVGIGWDPAHLRILPES